MRLLYFFMFGITDGKLFKNSDKYIAIYFAYYLLIEVVCVARSTDFQFSTAMTCSIESPFFNHESMGKIPNIPCSLLADDPSSLFRTRTRPKASPTTVTIPAKPTKNPIRRSLFILYRKCRQCRGTIENTKWKFAVNNPIIGKRLFFLPITPTTDNQTMHTTAHWNNYFKIYIIAIIVL